MVCDTGPNPRSEPLVCGDVLSIRELGRREWHKQSGHTKRSMVENTIYRYKMIIGREMRSRGLDGQRVEVQLACKILNRMARFGMPDSYKVACRAGEGGFVSEPEPCTNASITPIQAAIWP